MPTAREVSDACTDVLLPVLAPGPGVCATCRSVADPKYPLCWPCRSATITLAWRRADAVAPISYAVKGGQLANELWRYKGSTIIDREHYVLGFTAVLWRFLTEHEACLAAAAGAPDFSLVTTVRWQAGQDGRVRTSGQATVRTWSPETGDGTALRDDGSELALPAAAFAAGGLRALRPGQRIRVELDGDRVVLVTVATLAPP